MKLVDVVCLSIILVLVGCNRTPVSHSEDKHQANSAAAQSTSFEAQEHKACVAHQMSANACGIYTVLAYDATWKDNFGNEGRFLIERDGVRILANCGSQTCPHWIDAVGMSVEADKGIANWITYHMPECQSPTYVKTALRDYKRRTGRDGTIAQVCDETLNIEKIDSTYRP